MKKEQWLITALITAVLMASAIVFGQPAGGDIAVWIPFDSGTTKKDAQIPRNNKYVSIKLQSVYAYYKSGFLENIKQLIIASDVSFELQNRRIDGTTVNRSQQMPKSGEFIGINDHLAVLSPSTPSRLAIKISFRGIGEDRFKNIFDILSGSDLKVPLNLSDNTLGRVTGITSIVRSLLATPYTSNSPKQVLDIIQSFVLYSDAIEHVDALREGYLVVISGRENKSADLNKILQLPQGDLRINPQGQSLEFKDSNVWKPLADNSYVIFSITQSSVRGEDESPWKTKYDGAENAARKVVAGTPLDRAQEEALALWREGNVLLDADNNYIRSEREYIRSFRLNELKKILGTAGNAISFAGTDIPVNFTTMAADYKTLGAKEAATLAVTVQDPQGRPAESIEISIVNRDKPDTRRVATTDTSGRVTVRDLPPGEYEIQTTRPGFGKTSPQKIVIDPKELKTIAIKPGRLGPIG